jgi:hypothetical protein
VGTLGYRQLRNFLVLVNVRELVVRLLEVSLKISVGKEVYIVFAVQLGMVRQTALSDAELLGE